MQVISGKVQKAKKVVIYGPEGIGKSTLAEKFPRPIFIDTEGSTTELNVDRLPKPSSWEMLNQQVVWVKQQGSRFGTLVIDTIDWAEMLCVNNVCAQHGKNGIEDFGWGNGYTYTKEEFGRFLNLLSDVIESGIHVVLNAHAQIVKFDQPDEMGSYDRYQLKLGKKTSSQTAPLVKEWADMVLFINYKTFSVAADKDGKKHKAQGGMRTVYATHHPAWDAKNRHGLPDDFPLDYAYIAHIFEQQGAAVPAPSQAAQQAYGQMTGGEALPQTQAPAITAPPAASTTPPPAPVPEPTTIQQLDSALTAQANQQLNPNIPQSLRDMMIQHQVSESEIQIVVSNKGYYPMNTPITNYDPNFIDGVLVGAWPKVFAMVQEIRAQQPF